MSDASVKEVAAEMACALVDQLFRVKVSQAVPANPAAALAAAAAGWGETVTLDRALLSVLACLGVSLAPGAAKRSRPGEAGEDVSVMKKFKQLCEEEEDNEASMPTESGSTQEITENTNEVPQPKKQEAPATKSWTNILEESSITENSLKVDQKEDIELVIKCCERVWKRKTLQKSSVIQHLGTHFREEFQIMYKEYFLENICIKCDQEFSAPSDKNRHLYRTHQVLRKKIEESFERLLAKTNDDYEKNTKEVLEPSKQESSPIVEKGERENDLDIDISNSARVVHCTMQDCDKTWTLGVKRNRRFKILSHLIRHERFDEILRKESNGLFEKKKCIECDREFTSNSSMKFHFFNFHGVMKDDVEKECDLILEDALVFDESKTIEERKKETPSGQEFKKQNNEIDSVSSQEKITKEKFIFRCSFDCEKTWQPNSGSVRHLIHLHIIVHMKEKLSAERPKFFSEEGKCFLCNEDCKTYIDRHLVLKHNVLKKEFDRHFETITNPPKEVEKAKLIEEDKNLTPPLNLSKNNTGSVASGIGECSFEGCRRIWDENSIKLNILNHILTHFREQMEPLTNEFINDGICRKCLKQISRPCFSEYSRHLLHQHNILKSEIDAIYKSTFNSQFREKQTNVESNETAETQVKDNTKLAEAVSVEDNTKSAEAEVKDNTKSEEIATEKEDMPNSGLTKVVQNCREKFITCIHCAAPITRGKNEKYFFRNIRRHAVSHYNDKYVSLYSKYFKESNECSSCGACPGILKADRNNHLYSKHSVKKNEVDAIVKATIETENKSTSVKEVEVDVDTTDDLIESLLDSDEEGDSPSKKVSEKVTEAVAKDLTDIQKHLQEQMEDDSDSSEDEVENQKSDDNDQPKEEPSNRKIQIKLEPRDCSSTKATINIKSEPVGYIEPAKGENESNATEDTLLSDLLCQNSSSEMSDDPIELMEKAIDALQSKYG